MQSKAATVAEYLASLPEDRRRALEAVRKVVRANLDKDYEEGMQYGMIGYYVPHRVFPAGYHCDPKQPLPFAGLASQKNHMAVYLMGVYTGYGDDSATAEASWFEQAWKKTGKKLDMGKCCVRFKKLEDVALDVVGESVRRLPASKYIRFYTAALEAQRSRPKSKPAKKKAATKAAAPAKKKKASSKSK